MPRVLTEREMKDEKAVDPNRLLDLSNYFMAFNAFTKWSEETERTPDAFDKRGLMFARRYLPMLSEGVEQHIAPIIEQPSAQRLKPFYRRFDRSGTPTDKVQFRVEFLEQLFMWFRAHQGDMRTTFSGKGRRSAMALLQMSQEDNPVSIVASAAALPSVSGLQGPRNWIKKAAELMGAGLNDAEEAISDVESLANVASEIKDLEAQIAGAEPNSEKLAELTAKKEELLEQMSEQAKDKGVLQAAAAAAFKPHKGHQTDTGSKLSLNTQQEAAMVASGKKVIAAGAGSGKTRVLAGEVAYRINELGYDASSICAVSFTRKSSNELIKRVQDYGAVIDGAAASGFGTTHRLAGVTILGKYGKGSKRPKYFGKKQGWAPTTLVALAVKQVSMKGGDGKAPEPKCLFTGNPTEIPSSTLNTPLPSFSSETSPEAQALIEALTDGIELFAYGWPANFKDGGWARWSVKFLTDMKNKIENGGDPNDLSPGQKNQINKLMKHIEKQYGHTVRVASDDEPSIERKGNSKYQYWETPARQWFNINYKWEGAGDKSGKEGQQFSAAAVKQKIGIWKGMGATPEEVWYAAGPLEGKITPYTPEAAAYAAYEWLKGSNGEPDFRNTGDMDDLLIDATRALANNKRARGALQKRFKVILVDEAQDLNRTQHTLFGLLAGALDPETLKPTDKMKADTFGFIGDDKQAIYEFRGADPDQFIDKSDLGPNKGDFETLLLDTNYRSGQAIVDAANNLIKHNSKQIPMTCKANYEAKGDGSITAQSFGDPSEAGDYVAEYVADYAEANSTKDTKYGNFGIAVRSNAEAMHYALGMVKKGIPFVSKVNPFKSPPVKSMIAWMAFVEGGPSMGADAARAALKDCLRMPSSFLGKAFLNRVNNQMDPIGWLMNIDPYSEFRKNYAKNVENLIENIQACFGMHGSPDSPQEVYSTLLTTLKTSSGSSFFDSIVDSIKDDNGKMAELAILNTDGIPTDEQIKEAAEEELVLLKGLMGSKDSVDGVMEYVRELKAVNERVASGDDDDEKDAVIIGTMHSWKGLEVPKLFMPLVRGKFPRVQLTKGPDGTIECHPPSKDDPALASERRLAYVAITRAEDSCIMMDIANPSAAFAQCPPSQFISEACVKYEAEPQEQEAGKQASDEDPMLAVWDGEDFDQGFEWYDYEPTPEEEEEARMLNDLENIEKDFDRGLDIQDDLLSQWEKQHGDK